jgi:hypothetical protein
MAEFAEKYINPFTDYGFKKLFGEEPNKDLLLDFLNVLLREEQGEIKDLTYLKSEHLGTSEVDRKAIFDLYCENEKGEKFIVVDELETRFDKWLYVIRNLNRLDKVPDKLRERVFEKLFETAEIAKFTPDQIRSYEDSLKYYRDLKNSLDTAKEEGIEIGVGKGIELGVEKGKLEIAKKALEKGISIEDIVDLTGLSREQVEKLKQI